MHNETDQPAGVAVDRGVRPRAWAVDGNCIGASDGGPALWRREPTAEDRKMWADCGVQATVTPLYAPDDFVADVVGLDAMRELCALLVDLDNIEDPERTPFPAIEDRDWRAHAGKCSRALRMLMRRIVGSGPNVF